MFFGWIFLTKKVCYNRFKMVFQWNFNDYYFILKMGLIDVDCEE